MLWRLFPLVLLFLAAACDPCTGLGSCVSPQVRSEGEIRRGVGIGRDPRPAEAVPVKFVPTGGISLEEDSLVARTDSAGRFRLEGRARGEGDVVGDLWIYPPAPVEPVRIRGVRLRTSRAPGNVHPLGSWKVDSPYLGYQFYLFYRSTGKAAPGVEVTFRRTGGVPLEADTLRLTSDARGYVILRPTVSTHGDVVGDLTVHPLPPQRPVVLRGLSLRTFTTERYDSVIPVGIGFGLPYSAIVVWEETGQGAAGVEVEFHRTGGVPIYPDPFITRSDEHGTILLNPTPLAQGEVQGNVILRPSGGAQQVTIRDVRLRTVDDNRSPVLLGFWGIPE